MSQRCPDNPQSGNDTRSTTMHNTIALLSHNQNAFLTQHLSSSVTTVNSTDSTLPRYPAQERNKSTTSRIRADDSLAGYPMRAFSSEFSDDNMDYGLIFEHTLACIVFRLAIFSV